MNKRKPHAHQLPKSDWRRDIRVGTPDESIPLSLWLYWIVGFALFAIGYAIGGEGLAVAAGVAVTVLFMGWVMRD